HELAHVVQQGGGKEPLRLARLTEGEKLENLESSKFAGNERLEKAFDKDPTLKKGESGEAVRLVQEGLVADGFPMPVSTKPDGEMDGIFGDETFRTVQMFQRKHELADDGIVGRDTLRVLDRLAKTGAVIAAGCPTDAKAFEVTGERAFANPKFDPDFEGGNTPSLSTRAPSAPFRWNALVKLKGKAQGCFEVGFLQTLRSSFQAAVYHPQTGTREKMCLVLVPNPIRDAKDGVSEPWYMPPVRLGANCAAGQILPPGLGGDINETGALMDDNPFLKWCIFLAADAQNPARDCGPSNAAFRLSTVVETLAFDAWMVVRPIGSTDTNCFTFLRHATWLKSVEIILSTTGTLGFIRNNLGVTLVALGDGIGANKPDFGSDTAGSLSRRVCF
ncbi:MAG TPA: peptidoglycan-binding domain-containing protein, partial [Pyrinomonadaceae bacterium]|nr:peptidoglycan-binding domain-containing protein [Pyrinomonadaceae bacterium]